METEEFLTLTFNSRRKHTGEEASELILYNQVLSDSPEISPSARKDAVKKESWSTEETHCAEWILPLLVTNLTLAVYWIVDVVGHGSKSFKAQYLVCNGSGTIFNNINHRDTVYLYDAESILVFNIPGEITLRTVPYRYKKTWRIVMWSVKARCLIHHNKDNNTNGSVLFPSLEDLRLSTTMINAMNVW